MPSLVLPVPNEPRTTSAVSGLTLGCLMRGAQKLTNDHECDTVIKKSSRASPSDCPMLWIDTRPRGSCPQPNDHPSHIRITLMSILWTIIIGFVAGVIAKFIMPGPNEPAGFVLTTILGIVGAFVATFLGQAMGWYGPGQGAGLVGAVVGAIIVLLVYGMVAGRRTV